MNVPRYHQRTIYEGIYRSLIPDQKLLLWEKWMLKIDSVLEDDELIEMVHEALGQRHAHSQTRGRKATPSEVVLRLMVLKHVKNWSYETLEREARANLVYRDFSRIGGEAVPDSRTMVRLGQALGPEVTRKIHKGVVELAQEEKVVAGRKIRPYRDRKSKPRSWRGFPRYAENRLSKTDVPYAQGCCPGTNCG